MFHLFEDLFFSGFIHYPGQAYAKIRSYYSPEFKGGKYPW